MGAILTAMLPVLLQLLEETPALVADVKQAWDLLSTQTPPTPEQQSQIDAALDAAHAKLQAS